MVAKRGVKTEVSTMEPAAGPSGQNSEPSTPRRPAPARSPLVPPTGKRIRSSPVVLPVPGTPGGRAKLLPMDAPAPKRRFNRVGIGLALVVCLGTIPFTYAFQQRRVAAQHDAKLKNQQSKNLELPPEKQQWRQRGLDENTEKQVMARFGPPIISRNYNMADGAFVGPLVGQKRFVLNSAPDFEGRTKDAEVIWTYPQFNVIRELVWQLPDSYLTVWMREPRAEIDLTDPSSTVALPADPEGGGDWVVIDNMRVGKDLVKAAPAGGR